MNIYAINEEGTVLRKHQMKMLDMLVYIDKICRDNNIKYCLSGGTLLGAVRHGGFIPWDDDLDIILLKKDLKKLHAILLNDPSPAYALQANDVDRNYIAPYEKLRLNGTLIQENNGIDHLYKYRGIYIDLFYLEPALPCFHILSDKIQTRLVNMVKGRQTRLCSFAFKILSSITRKVLYPCFSFISFLFSSESLSYPLGSYFHTQFKKKWLYPLKELEFEGQKFYVPNCYEEMLRAQYGDYLKIPSEEEISMHINFIQFEN